jgi:hypothetical protein
VMRKDYIYFQKVAVRCENAILRRQNPVEIY